MKENLVSDDKHLNQTIEQFIELVGVHGTESHIVERFLQSYSFDEIVSDRLWMIFDIGMAIEKNEFY